MKVLIFETGQGRQDIETCAHPGSRVCTISDVRHPLNTLQGQIGCAVQQCA
jgi:hypothetical protein